MNVDRTVCHWISPLLWVVTPLFMVVTILGTATPARAGDFETGVGILGGALVGSLLGRDKNREQNALIGAVSGGLISYAVANSNPNSQDNTLTSSPFTTRYPSPTVTQSHSTITRFHPKTKRSKARIVAECQERQIERSINGVNTIMVGEACRSGNGRWVFQEPLRTSHKTRPSVHSRAGSHTTIIKHTSTPIIYTYTTPETIIYSNDNRRQRRINRRHRQHHRHDW